VRCGDSCVDLDTDSSACGACGNTCDEPANGSADWTCVRPGHWLFEGTGMREGDAIPGLGGWEHHGPPLGTMPGLEVLARGPVFSGGRPQKTEYAATMYPGPRNNVVFNAATIFWAQGLSSPPGHMLPWTHWARPAGPDDRVQRITHNLLLRAIRS
jgi:hypothetical protein